MDIAMIGLGKMGANMTTRLLRGGHRVVVYDLNERAIQTAEAEGAEGARILDEVVEKLPPPRVVWVMVPAGDPTEQTIRALAERLSPGDVVVDADQLHEGSGRMRIQSRPISGGNGPATGPSGPQPQGNRPRPSPSARGQRPPTAPTSPQSRRSQNKSSTRVGA